MTCTCCTDPGCCPSCPWCNHEPDDPNCDCQGCEDGLADETWGEEDNYEFRGRW